MTVNKSKFPPCFGKLDSVFPSGKDGLRNVPESCMPCYYRLNCMKNAVEGKKGIDIKQEINDRAYYAGNINFLQRWSRRKILKELKKNEK